MSDRMGGWVYATFRWHPGDGDFEAWVQTIADDGWQASEYGPGAWTALAGRRTYVLRVRRWTTRPAATAAN